jgi:hypothetical protein
LSNPQFQKLLRREMSRKDFLGFSALAVASLLGVYGLIEKLTSHATTPTASVEPETGTVNLPATKVNDTTASAGKAVKFGPQPNSGTFVLGVTKPVASNSGLAVNNPTLTVVKATSGDTITHSTDGAVYNNMDFQSFVVENGKKVTYNNCRFRGAAVPITKPYALINTPSSMTTADRPTLNFCTLKPTTPIYFRNCTKGGIIVNRCDLSGATDLLNNGGTGQIITATGCYLHDVTTWDGSAGSEHASDTRFPGATHNDMFECFGGLGHSLVGCNMEAYFNTDYGNPNSFKPWTRGGSGNGATYPLNNYCNGITVAAAVSVSSGTLTNNWFHGGEIGFQAPAYGGGHDSGHNWVFRGNRFGVDQHPYSGTSYQQIRWSKGMGTFDIDASNVYDTTSDVPSALRGQPLHAPSIGSTQTTYAVTK